MQQIGATPAVRSVLVLGLLVVAALAAALSAGVPLFKKRQADRLVDELCAKDGGIKVYEAIELPPSRIPTNWAAIPFQHQRKGSEEFYFVHSTKDIRGNSTSIDIAALTVFRTETGLYRAKDGKLLGTAIGFIRRGGDPVGPWHPSAYQCPSEATELELVRKTLIEQKR
jgi:hypothetical protein